MVIDIAISELNVQAGRSHILPDMRHNAYTMTEQEYREAFAKAADPLRERIESRLRAEGWNTEDHVRTFNGREMSDDEFIAAWTAAFEIEKDR